MAISWDAASDALRDRWAAAWGLRVALARRDAAELLPELVECGELCEEGARLLEERIHRCLDDLEAAPRGWVELARAWLSGGTAPQPDDPQAGSP